MNLPEDPGQLKSLVLSHWEEETCGTRLGSSESREAYFEEIARARYSLEPYILDFAGFENAAGQRVLEIGVGAGSDFENWVRNGAVAFGMDLSETAVKLTRERLDVNDLTHRPHALQVGDAERLPFRDDAFDVVYAWGVLHHTPETRAAFAEARRVLKPGGELRAMVYQVPSWTGWNLWVYHALLKGRIHRSVKDVLYEHLESPGTKAYTLEEIHSLLDDVGFDSPRLSTRLTPADELSVMPSRKYRHPLHRILWRLYPRWLVRRLGDRLGLALLIRARKDPARRRHRSVRPSSRSEEPGERLRLCYVVDGRSPIARNFIEHFAGSEHEVHVVSTYPCDAEIPATSMRSIPVGLARLTGLSGRTGGRSGKNGNSRLVRLRGGALSTLASRVHYLMGPLDARRKGSTLRGVVDEIRPDIVHAMRVPLEGLVAGAALKDSDVPFVLSIWGNDFTLFANRYPLIERATRSTLERVDAIHADCHRDVRLARELGFDEEKPTVVLPGNGGIHMDVFRPGPVSSGLVERLGIPEGWRVVLNPRGFRVYVRNDTFFRSIPRVLERHRDVVFLGVEMEGNGVALQWVDRLGIGDNVRLVPHVDLAEMAELFRLADVVVSPSEHDGTPNTILEAMASGAFPVVGDIESLREWIEDGENGLLCDPGEPGSLADAVVRALDDVALRQRAGKRNRDLIGERAGHERSMERMERFYRSILRASGRATSPVG